MNTGNIVLTGVYMLILVSGLALGEVANENSGKQNETWGATVAGCRFSVAADKSSYHVSEPIRLRLILENVGEGRISASDFSLTSDYMWDLRLPNGDPAPLTLFGKRRVSFDDVGSARSWGLDPGERRIVSVSRSDRMYLNRLYDMTLAGEYTLTVKRRFYPAGAECWKDDWEEVSSNTIKIVVREEIEEKKQTEQESEKQEKENSLSDENK